MGARFGICRFKVWDILGEMGTACTRAEDIGLLLGGC